MGRADGPGYDPGQDPSSAPDGERGLLDHHPYRFGAVEIHELVLSWLLGEEDVAPRSLWAAPARLSVVT